MLAETDDIDSTCGCPHRKVNQAPMQRRRCSALTRYRVGEVVAQHQQAKFHFVRAIPRVPAKGSMSHESAFPTTARPAEVLRHASLVSRGHALVLVNSRTLHSVFVT